MGGAIRTSVVAATLAGALLSAGCMTTAFERRYDPRPAEQPAADVAAEISALAASLEERAALRTSLGAARVVVEDLEVLRPREARYRYATLDERDANAVRATVRHELEMALSNRLNVVDVDAARGDGARPAGATHVIRGTILRTGGDVDLSLKLVDLRDGWIVATAQRRIERFVARDAVPVGRAGESDARRRTAEVETSTDVAGEPAAQEPTPVAQEPELEPVIAAEPVAPEVDADGVPTGAVIEFDAGPAASRLEALGGGTPPR